MSEIKVGDTVRLKSGGPLMTVEEIGDYSVDGDGPMKASCTWFDGNAAKSQLITLHSFVGELPD